MKIKKSIHFISVVLAVVLCAACIVPVLAAGDDMPDDFSVTVTIVPEYSGTGKDYAAGDFGLDGIADVKTIISDWDFPQWKNDMVVLYAKEPYAENLQKIKAAVKKDKKVEGTDRECISCLVEVPYGDVDGDNMLTPEDARRIMRIVAGYDELSKRVQLWLVDMDFDGRVTSEDARLALRIAVRLDEGKYTERYL